jgi:hypothetical protein
MNYFILLTVESSAPSSKLVVSACVLDLQLSFHDCITCLLLVIYLHVR